MSKPAPALFLGHGSPMNVLEENAFTQTWRELATRFARPRAILCVSAHWETDGPAVTASPQPRTIHDFTGFPAPLYDITYPAPGDPALARRAGALTGARPSLDWGLDHGSWGVLRALYPAADVPVVQFSLDRRATPAQHYAIGQKLASLRHEGVLIAGSGNIVHNLRFFRGPQRDFDWAVRFNEAVKEKVLAGDHQALMDFTHLTPDSILPVPTPEHFLPLLYVLAAQGKGERPEILTDAVTGSVSMTSVAIGL
jgi:4,5-DOPA dioxygenase extradiol